MERTRIVFISQLFYLIISLILTFCIPLESFSQECRLVSDVVYSKALEGNLLGDNPNRDVNVYLPPTYDKNPNTRFPVIYLLHGYLSDNVYYENRFEIENLLKSYYQSDSEKQMIIAIPNAYNKYRGSYYINSSVTGNWEDFITQDLVTYIDNHYRTKRSANSRGISGHSMGGYGAIRIAMKYPEIFGAVYGMSSDILVFKDFILSSDKVYLLRAVKVSQFNGINGRKSWQVQDMIAMAAAFSPDPSNKPLMCQFPITANGEVIDSIWKKWLLHDPFTMVESHKENLLKLKGIKFDCGTQDRPILWRNQAFSKRLGDEKIPHEYVEYDGKHINKLRTRIKEHMLPFFSNTLE